MPFAIATPRNSLTGNGISKELVTQRDANSTRAQRLCNVVFTGAMVQHPDPDVFARHRLFQRSIICLVAQTVSTAASADQIYQIIRWADALSFEKTLQPLELFTKCNTTSSRSLCCSSANQPSLSEAYSSFEAVKHAGLSSFILVFVLSITGFIVTLSNYLAFIKSLNVYLRKLTINTVTLFAFILQCISCASFDSGVKSKLRHNPYCSDMDSQVYHIARDCLSETLTCPNSSILLGYLVIMIITTSLIPIVVIYSCKWRERVFQGLAEEISFCRKPTLFTMQRSMLHNVKAEVELEQEFERRTLEQLEESLYADYEVLQEYEKSRHRDTPNVKTAMNEELEHYKKKLAKYYIQLSSIMNKSEAIKELRQLDLEILGEHTRYLNDSQKLPIASKDSKAKDTEDNILITDECTK